MANGAVLVLVVLMGPKVTLFVTLPVEFTCIASPVFKIDAGDLVDMLDADEPAAAMAAMVGG